MLKPIKNEMDYEIALERIFNLMQNELKIGSTEADELEVLSILVEAYENKNHALASPNPIEAIKFRMDQSGIGTAEITKILGGRSRKSEIFAGKRKLSISMIRSLHKQLNIPAESLINEY